MFYLFSNNILVNFDEVISIKKTPNRFIINLNCSIVRNNETTADYVYIDSYTESDLKLFNCKFFKDNFIQVAGIYLNRNKISSVKFCGDKIIYNLTVSKTHIFNKDGKSERVDSCIFYYERADIEKFNAVAAKLKTKG